MARAEGRTVLTEVESKRLLADAGIAVPAFEVAESVDEAVASADEIGYPVVVKVASPDVQHKSEWRGGIGVSVGLDSRAAVWEAADRILAAAADEGTEAVVLVEAAADVDTGTEMIVGGVRKPAFGPVVVVGLGGVYTEVLEDVTHRLAPIDQRDALTMVDDLEGARLLRGYRDRPPADLVALADAIVAVGDLLVEEDAIAEIDVNPMLVAADGVTALDALVIATEDT